MDERRVIRASTTVSSSRVVSLASVSFSSAILVTLKAAARRLFFLVPGAFLPIPLKSRSIMSLPKESLGADSVEVGLVVDRRVEFIRVWSLLLPLMSC